jgi:hypothetical protein
MEMEWIAEFRGEYESIFDSLMEYLNEEMRRINGDVVTDSAAVIKSWEGMRGFDDKIKHSIDKGGRNDKDRTSCQGLCEKWAVKR